MNVFIDFFDIHIHEQYPKKILEIDDNYTYLLDYLYKKNLEHKVNLKNEDGKPSLE